mmetsp:Transcript_32277/g.48156  ORF Transcript_32277/g.48156 Transcript_32277/m.48156 type:complete len:214 (+) Transcript_32277:817-1458(+)
MSLPFVHLCCRVEIVPRKPSFDLESQKRLFFPQFFKVRDVVGGSLLTVTRIDVSFLSLLKSNEKGSSPSTKSFLVTSIISWLFSLLCFSSCPVFCFCFSVLLGVKAGDLSLVETLCFPSCVVWYLGHYDLVLRQFRYVRVRFTPHGRQNCITIELPKKEVFELPVFHLPVDSFISILSSDRRGRTSTYVGQRSGVGWNETHRRTGERRQSLAS